MSDFMICIDNRSNPASLILGKVYRKIPDADAEPRAMLRIVDEDTSEPDGYLYPTAIFARSSFRSTPNGRSPRRAADIRASQLGIKS